MTSSNRHLSIGHKFVIVIALAVTLPLLAVGYYSSHKSSEALISNALTDMTFGVKEIAARMQSFLDVVKQDATFIEGVPPVQGIIRARDNADIDEQGKSNYTQWVERLNAIFSNFGSAKPYYLQIRYLNEHGDELVRVDFDKGMPTVIPKEKLQNKSNASYFTETMKLAKGHIHVSPFNLNREAGVIQEPYKPVVRFGVPVFDPAGKRRGIMVLNVLGQGILNYVARGQSGVLGDFYLANKAGFYLYHRDQTKTWGFDLDRQDNLFSDIAGLEDLATTGQSHGTLADLGDRVIAYGLVHPSADDHEDRWILVHSAPRAALLQAVSDFQQALFLLTIISLLVSVGSGLWLSRSWFVKPLGRILTVLDEFSRGNLSVRLNDASGDEIGGVCKAFNLMAQQQQESQQREHQQSERERQQLEDLRKAADIRDRVEVLLEHIKKVASGDLRELIDPDGDDELAKLGFHLNEMTEALADVSTEIRDLSELIANTLAEVTSATSSQMASASQQARAISETTITLEEMKRTSMQTMEQASALGLSAERTSMESSQGLSSVQQAAAGMEAIRGQMAGIAQTILALSEQTHQIGEITGAVNGLAQQSKMLALNASIEAAKAGEAGKGFAVVAQEVKDLADQSQQATGQVQKILQDIRHATDRAVQATEEGSKGVDSGMSMVKRTGEVMQELSNVINETVMASQRIVDAVRQEAAGIDQVNDAITEVNASIGQFVSSTRETQEANGKLAEMTGKLRNSVSVYKVSG